MAVLIQDQQTADPLVVVEAAHQVLEWLCLQSRRVPAAMEEGQLCITGVSTVAEAVDRQHLQVRTASQPKDAEEEKRHL